AVGTEEIGELSEYHGVGAREVVLPRDRFGVAHATEGQLFAAPDEHLPDGDRTFDRHLTLECSRQIEVTNLRRPTDKFLYIKAVRRGGEAVDDGLPLGHEQLCARNTERAGVQRQA